MPKMNGYVKIYKNNILEDMKIKKNNNIYTNIYDLNVPDNDIQYEFFTVSLIYYL